MRVLKVRHIVSVAVLAVFFSTLFSMPALAGQKEDLRKSMKARYPKVKELKLAGTIGETHLGFVEALSKEAGEDADLQKLIKAENEDRKTIYTMIAKKTGATPDEVAKNNALRIFNAADENVLFKGPDGKWTAKKDVKGEKG